jgi:predicted component of type VI protein secretion system
MSEQRRQAVVKAESEVLKLGVPQTDLAVEGADAVSAVDARHIKAVVEECVAQMELRLQAFFREELRRAIITITKLDIPREAPPPPQFSAQQFRQLPPLFIRGCYILQ